MEIKRILWPTDLSGNSENALPFVVSMSRKFDSEIHILYVMEELAIHEPWYGVFEKTHIEKIHDWERQKAAERLDALCDEHLKGCPLFVRHISAGDPAEEILKLIGDAGIDLVTLARVGRGGRFKSGSVSEKVTRNAPVPVIIIP